MKTESFRTPFFGSAFKRHMGCASASGVSVDLCLPFPSCMVFVSFGTVRRSSFQHLRPFVTAPLYGRRSSRLSTAPAVCIFAPSLSLLTPRPPGPICEISHLVCAVHCVLLRLSVSAVSGFCLCFTGVPLTCCLYPRPLFQTDQPGPHLTIGADAPQSSGPDLGPEFFVREYELPTLPRALAPSSLPLHPGGSSSSAGFPCKICWLTPPAIGGF